MNNKNPNGVSSEESHKKTCADCGTSKTPLWRGGPAGPKVNQLSATKNSDSLCADQSKRYRVPIGLVF